MILCCLHFTLLWFTFQKYAAKMAMITDKHFFSFSIKTANAYFRFFFFKLCLLKSISSFLPSFCDVTY